VALLARWRSNIKLFFQRLIFRGVRDLPTPFGEL
jgi:hypothetical protein